MSRRSRPAPDRKEQASLWPDAEVTAAFSLLNRRRSLIRRLDHLVEDAANEQFHEATVVLRDALERLRLALLKDTLMLQEEDPAH
ncbi:hypothetical protein JYK14_20475 [Siccirubricoccus sp. KC 17139]|uniref:Uncharacterized protein n=1 Tax=Siccirubricoccus soli TaxID=2899147 RepID=A0ABT1D9A6_9PROT|nr:hypothetical protein [Siccirubricoccus soli]MCO6418520.1 hypothetical protein [Siccirubricoccus soli]MCP2684655.1 hypothetical protein [Siccirubricoccus soli]